MVRELLKSRGKILGLKPVSGARNLGRQITVSEINRPGLAIAGHMEQFRSERIQIIGQGEYAYCQKEDPRRVSANLQKMFAAPDIPCVIVTGGVKPLPVIKQACAKAGIPLLVTSEDTSTFIREITTYLDDQLAATTYVHGVLVNVYGLGVLIQGDSGVGKSECALELLKRGHILIADDVVEVKRRIGYMLVGNSPKNIKHYMEVRGLGIIDVELLFGIGSIMDQSLIEMHVKLESVVAGTLGNYDRTGLAQAEVNILEVPVPSLRLPVTPGRNLAVLIEVASLNQRLKNQGYFVAKKFNESLIREMNKK
ncbi:MAG: HPr(Ser) kinase/phosphatase [Elusimicrobia bacterium GWA2_62_23]|nr:MAG: HPr(Ser) kinase/phosphatase [Elusimicrobia bacterium GWA2_62_23]OGR68853.1 MAG: HPr(Ser) kinase/phosphatase [Elusimicrobia bacterium GWC2_63_65]